MTDSISATGGRGQMAQAVTVTQTTQKAAAQVHAQQAQQVQQVHAPPAKVAPAKPAANPSERSVRPSRADAPEAPATNDQVHYAKSAESHAAPAVHARSEADRFEYVKAEKAAPEEAAADTTNATDGGREISALGTPGAQNSDEMDKAVKTFKDYIASVPSEMNFSYDKEAERPVFKLVNPVTGEVLKQFPPDEFLTMVKRLREVSYAFDKGGALMDYKL